MARKNDDEIFGALTGETEESNNPLPPQTPKGQSAEEHDLDRATSILTQLHEVQNKLKDYEEDVGLNFVNLDNKLRQLTETYRDFIYYASKVQEAIDNNKYSFELSEDSYKQIEGKLAKMTVDCVNAFNNALQNNLDASFANYKSLILNAYSEIHTLLRKDIDDAKKAHAELDDIRKNCEKKGIFVSYATIRWLIIRMVPLLVLLIMWGTWALAQYITYTGQQIMAWITIFLLSTEVFVLIYHFSKWTYQKYYYD